MSLSFLLLEESCLQMTESNILQNLTAFVVLVMLLCPNCEVVYNIFFYFILLLAQQDLTHSPHVPSVTVLSLNWMISKGLQISETRDRNTQDNFRMVCLIVSDTVSFNLNIKMLLSKVLNTSFWPNITIEQKHLKCYTIALCIKRETSVTGSLWLLRSCLLSCVALETFDLRLSQTRSSLLFSRNTTTFYNSCTIKSPLWRQVAENRPKTLANVSNKKWVPVGL